MQYLLMALLLLVGLFLILIVLIQRGRGGGLAGAFGGMGGQSAFGTKAGDLFTRITMVTAAVWILLCIVTVKYLGTSGDILSNVSQPAPTLPPAAQPGAVPTTDKAPDATGPAATTTPLGGDAAPASEPAAEGAAPAAGDSDAATPPANRATPE